MCKINFSSLPLKKDSRRGESEIGKRGPLGSYLLVYVLLFETLTHQNTQKSNRKNGSWSAGCFLLYLLSLTSFSFLSNLFTDAVHFRESLNRVWICFVTSSVHGSLRWHTQKINSIFELGNFYSEIFVDFHSIQFLNLINIFF